MLAAGQAYDVIEVDTTDAENPSYIVRCDNPSFNADLPESDANPAIIEVGVYDGEFAISEDQTPVNAEAAPVETPAPAKTKGKAKAAAAPAAEVAPVEEVIEELENEDADVLALVNGEENLIDVARDLEADIESKNYTLGGVLFHIHKDGSYKELDDGAYAEDKGFEAFVETYFNFGYRKAMNLIQIYTNFTKAGIENPAEVVAQLGWTKASKIAPTLTAETAVDLIELASTNTVKSLSEAIQTQNVSVGGTPGEKKAKTIIKLVYFEDEGASIAAALASVKETQGLKSIEEAFAFIVAEFEMGQGEAAPVAAAPKQAAARPAARTAAAPAVKAAVAAAAKPTVRRATAQAAA